jgi:hypothetical protein
MHWGGEACREQLRGATPAGTTRLRDVYIHEAKAIRQLAEHLGMPPTDPHAVVDALLGHMSWSAAPSAARWASI